MAEQNNIAQAFYRKWNSILEKLGEEYLSSTLDIKTDFREEERQIGHDLPNELITLFKTEGGFQDECTLFLGHGIDPEPDIDQLSLSNMKRRMFALTGIDSKPLVTMTETEYCLYHSITIGKFYYGENPSLIFIGFTKDRKAMLGTYSEDGKSQFEDFSIENLFKMYDKKFTDFYEKKNTFYISDGIPNRYKDWESGNGADYNKTWNKMALTAIGVATVLAAVLIYYKFS